MNAYKVAAYVPVSREFLDDVCPADAVTLYIATETRETLLWAAAGRERPSRLNRSPFADYRPRLWGWWR